MSSFFDSAVTHFYSLYGLTLESQVAIPGLANSVAGDRSSASGRIQIEIGDPPAWISDSLTAPAAPLFPATSGNQGAKNALRLYSRNEGKLFHLVYPDGAQFALDAQTRQVWAWAPSSLTFEDLATYLVGPVMGFLLRQRGILALHASCFCSLGQAFAICGGPQSGKSTMAAALALRGVKILCEDIAALRERIAVFYVAPGYPRVNLWPDSVANLLGPTGELPRITPNWEKRFLPLEGAQPAFEGQSRPLATVYIIGAREEGSGAPRIERISPRSAALLLVQNTYMNYLLNKAQRAAELDMLVRLVSSVRVRRLVPHAGASRLGDLCDLLEADAKRSIMEPGFTEFAARPQP